jgi:hypothetical protein
MIGWVVAHSVLLFSMIMKMLQFLKINEKYGMMINLVLQVTKDLKSFIVFLFTWLLFFSVLYGISGISLGELEEVSPASALFINMFRNCVGDIQMPIYNYWTKYPESYGIQFFMVTYAWILFLLHELFLLVILLNFLIAFISQKYDQITSTE